MKRKPAAVLLIILLMSGILGEIVSEIQVPGVEFHMERGAGNSVIEGNPTISESLPADHHVLAVKPKALSGSLLFCTQGKRNNALFIRNIIGKVLLAFFTAFYSGTGQSFAIIQMICMAFTGLLVARIRILHQTDGKKRSVFCLEIPQKIEI